MKNEPGAAVIQTDWNILCQPAQSLNVPAPQVSGRADGNRAGGAAVERLYRANGPVGGQKMPSCRRLSGVVAVDSRDTAHNTNHLKSYPHHPRFALLETSMARPVTLFTGQWADLPFSEMAQKTKGFGYDGIELGVLGRPLRGRHRALSRTTATAPISDKPWMTLGCSATRLVLTWWAKRCSTTSTNVTKRFCPTTSGVTALPRG